MSLIEAARKALETLQNENPPIAERSACINALSEALQESSQEHEKFLRIYAQAWAAVDPDWCLVALSAKQWEYSMYGAGPRSTPYTFEVGKTYRTLSGKSVKIIAEHNRNTGYACVQGDDEKWRYDRPQDAGRVTGSPNDCPDNLIVGSEQ